jgi:hypothetical protein
MPLAIKTAKKTTGKSSSDATPMLTKSLALKSIPISMQKSCQNVLTGIDRELP